jgi:hypothetical protein
VPTSCAEYFFNMLTRNESLLALHMASYIMELSKVQSSPKEGYPTSIYDHETRIRIGSDMRIESG